MALSACVSELPAISQDGIPQSGVAVGRVLAVLTGERSRKYEPAVRLFEAVTYLGTWRFGIDSPQYGRMVSVSVVSDGEDRAEALETLSLNDPSVAEGVATSVVIGGEISSHEM